MVVLNGQNFLWANVKSEIPQGISWSINVFDLH